MATAKKTTEQKKEYKTLWEALIEARHIIATTSMKKEGRNDFSKYDYFTPSQVHNLVEDACYKTGLFASFQLKRDELGVYGLLSVVHAASGEREDFMFATEIADIKGTNGAQKLGGTITYAERYAKSSVFGITDNNLDLDAQADKAPKQQPKPTNTKPASSKEEQFVAYIAKQGGLTDALKVQIKKASGTWDAKTIKELIVKSGVKTIKPEDVDAILS